MKDHDNEAYWQDQSSRWIVLSHYKTQEVQTVSQIMCHIDHKKCTVTNYNAIENNSHLVGHSSGISVFSSRTAPSNNTSM